MLVTRSGSWLRWRCRGTNRFVLAFIWREVDNIKAPRARIMVHGISLMRRCCILVAAALAWTVASAPAAFAGKVTIAVNKTTQQISVAVDGKPRWSWKVSTGLTKFDTPSGVFTPFRMEEDHYSKEWDDAPMPHAIFFTKDGHAIHGSLEERRLGRRASHGCVRLSRRNAAKLFALVRANGLANTRVSVFAEPQRPTVPPNAAPQPLAPPVPPATIDPQVQAHDAPAFAAHGQ